MFVCVKALCLHKANAPALMGVCIVLPFTSENTLRPGWEQAYHFCVFSSTTLDIIKWSVSGLDEGFSPAVLPKNVNYSRVTQNLNFEAIKNF